MTLFKSSIAKDVWVEAHCCRCYRFGDCSILARALRTDRKPVEWDRNQRAQVMADAYRCNEFRRNPPRTKPKSFEDVPMFDVGAPVDHINYVAIDGDWPERPTKDTDHA